MKLHVNVDYFKKLLNPILKNCIFDKVNLEFAVDENGIKLKAKHEDINVQLKIDCKKHPDLKYICIQKGVGVVNVRTFKVFLIAFPKGKVILINFPSHMTISDLANPQQMNTNLEIEYAVTENELECKKLTHEFSIPARAFVNALKAVRFAIGREISKPYYQGIFLVMSEGKLSCIAGSGGLFAVKHVQTFSKANKKKKVEIFLPLKSVNSVITALNTLSSGTVNLAYFDKRYILSLHYLEIVFPRITDYKCVAINKILDYNFPHRLYINSKNLKLPVKCLMAAAAKDQSYFKSADMNYETSSGTILFNYGTTSQCDVEVNPGSVVPLSSDKPLMLKTHPAHLHDVYNSWPDQTELEMLCEINGKKPIVVKPKNEEFIKDNEPDVIFFATYKLPWHQDDVPKENTTEDKKDNQKESAGSNNG